MNKLKVFCKAFIASFSLVLFSSTALSCISSQVAPSLSQDQESGDDFIQIVEVPSNETTPEESISLTDIISFSDYKELNPETLAIPICDGILSDSHEAPDHEVHTYNGFTLCYRESYEQSEWVAYVLTKDEVLNAEAKRSNDFKSDTLISTESASPSDYKNSGYDRGHLAPSADMRWSRESMNDCFLMSNMSPQSPALNRRIWKNLEEAVRDWALEYGYVVVVTGPLLEKPASSYRKIGKNKVCVPEWFYKVLIAFEKEGESSIRVKSSAFLMPNEVPEGADMDFFRSTIDIVEKRSGLDFFSELPDYVENYVEAQSSF